MSIISLILAIGCQWTAFSVSILVLVCGHSSPAVLTMALAGSTLNPVGFLLAITDPLLTTTESSRQTLGADPMAAADVA